MEPSRGKYRHLGNMEGADPEKLGERGRGAQRNGTDSQRSKSASQRRSHPTTDLVSASFLDKKQQLFKCVRNKDKNKDSKFQLSSVLGSLSKEDRKRLCQETDDRGNTALHYAVKAGNLDICQSLYRSGADLNAKGQNKMKALQFAARYGDENRAKEVWVCMKWIMDELQKKPKDNRGSVKYGDKEEKYDVCERDKYDFSLLHHAIQNTNWEETPTVAEELLKLGEFKVTDIDKQGNTSLHLAAEFDKQERHKILDIFLGNKNISKEDLKKCIETRNKQGKTPLHIACGVGNPESVKQLLEATKDLEIKVPSIIDSPDNDGQHPLHLAIESGNLEMMKILMEEGVAASKEAIKCAVRFVQKMLFKFLFTFILQDRQCGRF